MQTPFGPRPVPKDTYGRGVPAGAFTYLSDLVLPSYPGPYPELALTEGRASVSGDWAAVSGEGISDGVIEDMVILFHSEACRSDQSPTLQRWVPADTALHGTLPCMSGDWLVVSTETGVDTYIMTVTGPELHSSLPVPLSPSACVVSLAVSGSYLVVGTSDQEVYTYLYSAASDTWSLQGDLTPIYPPLSELSCPTRFGEVLSLYVSDDAEGSEAARVAVTVSDAGSYYVYLFEPAQGLGDSTAWVQSGVVMPTTSSGTGPVGTVGTAVAVSGATLVTAGCRSSLDCVIQTFTLCQENKYTDSIDEWCIESEIPTGAEVSYLSLVDNILAVGCVDEAVLYSVDPLSPVVLSHFHSSLSVTCVPQLARERDTGEGGSPMHTAIIQCGSLAAVGSMSVTLTVNRIHFGTSVAAVEYPGSDYDFYRQLSFWDDFSLYPHDSQAVYGSAYTVESSNSMTVLVDTAADPTILFGDPHDSISMSFHVSMYTDVLWSPFLATCVSLLLCACVSVYVACRWRGVYRNTVYAASESESITVEGNHAAILERVSPGSRVVSQVVLTVALCAAKACRLCVDLYVLSLLYPFVTSRFLPSIREDLPFPLDTVYDIVRQAQDYSLEFAHRALAACLYYEDLAVILFHFVVRGFAFAINRTIVRWEATCHPYVRGVLAVVYTILNMGLCCSTTHILYTMWNRQVSGDMYLVTPMGVATLGCCVIMCWILYDKDTWIGYLAKSIQRIGGLVTSYMRSFHNPVHSSRPESSLSILCLNVVLAPFVALYYLVLVVGLLMVVLVSTAVSLLSWVAVPVLAAVPHLLRAMVGVYSPAQEHIRVLGLSSQTRSPSTTASVVLTGVVCVVWQLLSLPSMSHNRLGEVLVVLLSATVTTCVVDGYTFDPFASLLPTKGVESSTPALTWEDRDSKGINGDWTQDVVSGYSSLLSPTPAALRHAELTMTLKTNALLFIPYVGPTCKVVADRLTSPPLRVPGCPSSKRLWVSNILATLCVFFLAYQMAFPTISNGQLTAMCVVFWVFAAQQVWDAYWQSERVLGLRSKASDSRNTMTGVEKYSSLDLEGVHVSDRDAMSKKEAEAAETMALLTTQTEMAGINGYGNSALSW
ncbi:hypothetical protein KIPB_000158 [Kipferlia bialata]|uniref:Transmembrane protein n=1 Tax=Kipferlia bialata TaxID=797122 RepID=A0A9K3CNR9_9EUKA|nr:hypothetical protein KIPB_000158 [Kipferlia bialata]|eukprot:g158.t1